MRMEVRPRRIGLNIHKPLPRPMHVRQPMLRQLLAHRRAIQTQPLGGEHAIALQAAHQLLQERRLHALE